MRKYPTPLRLVFITAGLLLSTVLTRAADAEPAVPTVAAPAPTATTATAAADAAPKPPTPPYLSPAESAKLFQLAPGYHLELVLSEPTIREPVVSVFDGNGRLYVAEMRSYMQDADATNEKAPISRVSLHWSSKGDGNFDKHTVFVDNMVLPRMILPLKDSVLIQETFTGDVYEYRDTDHDGVSDEKKLFYKFDLPRDNNLEHQPSGLIWTLDNWIYSTYNALRIRWTPNGAISERTSPNGGQWGLTQDNYGKTFFSNAGNDTGPLTFQQPIVYGAFRMTEEQAPGYREVFPLVGLSDAQPGMRYVRPENGTLNHTTSSAGLDIFRGDRLPADLVGDLLFGEPVGRLVRRSKVEVREGITVLTNPYQSEKSEFIRSKDPYFRPVNVVTGPDGTVYITDMYRGIIQQGNWTRKGSYLRGVIDRYGIADKINGGRVWRLVYDGMQPGPTPHMIDETPAQLVAHLSHPNGWWRDTAQKLIVLSQDKSVVPALQSLARTSTNALARSHAIWTLEGLDALQPALVREKLKDTDSHVRIAAIRAGETLFKNGDASLKDDILGLSKDPDPNVGIQAMLTANLLKLPEASAMISKTALSNPVAGVKQIAIQLLNPIGGTIGAQFTGPERQQLEKGQTIFLQLCFACHGFDGKGTPMDGKTTTLAPPLAGSPTATLHRDAIINALLFGVTGPVRGQTYEGLMIPMGSNEDAWIAAVASYVRTSFGNQAPLVSAEDVARVRAANATRKEAWTLADLQQRVPQPLTNQAAWKLTSNRPGKSGEAAAAEVGEVALSFSVPAAQAMGAWLQIELPEKTRLTEVRVSSAKSPRNYPRGYKVELSTDGENWGEPVATGRGTGPTVEASFPPADAKWVRITQTQNQAQFGRGGGGGGGGRGGRGGAGGPGGGRAGGAGAVDGGVRGGAEGAPGAAPDAVAGGAPVPPGGGGFPGGPGGGFPGGGGGPGGFGGAATAWTVDEVILFRSPAPVTSLAAASVP